MLLSVPHCPYKTRHSLDSLTDVMAKRERYTERREVRFKPNQNDKIEAALEILDSDFSNWSRPVLIKEAERVIKKKED
jgi:uncharacterized protein (DUF1778 family)